MLLMSICTDRSRTWILQNFMTRIIAGSFRSVALTSFNTINVEQLLDAIPYVGMFVCVLTIPFMSVCGNTSEIIYLLAYFYAPTHFNVKYN